jgi:hypothetical protein
MSKDDSIVYGAKRAGITWLFHFHYRSSFNRVRAGAKRAGMSLAEFLCRLYPSLTGAQELPEEPRKFKEEDAETAKLKVKILECDAFTRRCLERQAKGDGYESIEEFINAAVFHCLAVGEEDSVVDARTGEVVLARCTFPVLQYYKPDKGVPAFEHAYYKPVKRIPAGTIVEQCV